MVDDQDRCECLNAFSGTGSTGYSWTKSRKMIVVVVIFLLVCFNNKHRVDLYVQMNNLASFFRLLK